MNGRKRESSGSMERKREEKELRTENGAIGWELWSGICQREGNVWKGLKVWREGEKELGV